MSDDDMIVDRFAKRERIKPGGVARARRQRREMNYAEARLWEAVRRLKANVRRQAPIGPYVADFVHHRSKLAIEVDGAIHALFDNPERDAKRDAWFKAEGWRVLRLDANAVGDDPDGAAEQIRKEIESPFPLEGGRAGDGGGHTATSGPEFVTLVPSRVPAELPGRSRRASSAGVDDPPPSPTLPPSRGKGEEA